MHKQEKLPKQTLDICGLNIPQQQATYLHSSSVTWIRNQLVAIQYRLIKPRATNQAQ